MRLGVLDVGSNTVHLLVVDAYPGARPLPAFSHKTELKLSAQLENGNSLSGPGESRLRGVVEEALSIAEDKGVEDIIAFATSAVREAVNGEQVLARIHERTGAQINVMTGQEEARLTFLAARRWFGWSAGKLLVLDIGGGSLEIGYGIDEEPDAAVSLPLGAGRLTRTMLPGDPPRSQDVKALRKHVRAQVAGHLRPFETMGGADHVVGTSKTFKQLARLSGAPGSEESERAPRMLSLKDLSDWVPKLAEMTYKERADLPGVSVGRAPQLLAGAVVAEAVLALIDVDEVQVCPWALREGIILRRLDWMRGAT